MTHLEGRPEGGRDEEQGFLTLQRRQRAPQEGGQVRRLEGDGAQAAALQCGHQHPADQLQRPRQLLKACAHQACPVTTNTALPLRSGRPGDTCQQVTGCGTAASGMWSW